MRLHRITTDISPCALRVGFTVISTSWPSAGKNSISRPMEKFPARLRIRAETCGCLMPSSWPAWVWVSPRALTILWICSVSRAFRSSCSGLGRPRSAKTLPEPSSTRTFFLRMSVLPFPVMPFRLGKAPADQLNLLFRRRDAGLRFLLEHVQDIHRIVEMRGVDGPIRVRAVPLDNLHDPRPAESLQRFGCRIGHALLSSIKRLPDVPAHLLRHFAKVAAA